MKNLPLVSIIVLYYNGLKFIRDCISSILATDYPSFEVIVVDNGSTDGGIQVIERSFSSNTRLRIVRSSKNLGFAAGNNLGYIHAKGKYIVFLNQDTYVEPSWIMQMIRYVEKNPTIGAAQPLIRGFSNDVIDSAGQHIDVLGYGHPLSGTAEMALRLPSIYETFYADGAALLVRRDAVEKAGFDGLPFDGDYFLYYEDADLGWRIRLAGYKVVVIKHSIIYHARGARNLRSMHPYFVYTHTKNRIATLLKNYEFGNLLRYLPILILIETIRLAVLLPINARHSIAIISAFIHVLRDLRKKCFKRRHVQNMVRRVPDSKILKYMRRFSILHLMEGFRKYYQV